MERSSESPVRPRGGALARARRRERERGRGLDEVLHYFIPEDEQREARSRARDAAAGSTWCIPVDPRRPLALARVWDLAAARARSASDVRVIAPFAPGPLAPATQGVAWRVVPHADAARALDGPGLSFWLIEPARLTEVWHAAPRRPEGLLLFVDGCERGVETALERLRAVADLPPTQIGVSLVGARDATLAEALAGRLSDAARRQLGLEVRDLGALDADPASWRSLLFGVTVLDIDAGGPAAHSVDALGRSLETPR